MKILGIDIRQPTMSDVIVSTALSTAFMALVALAKQLLDLRLDRPFAVFLFCAVLWTMLGGRIGIRVEKGWRHYVLNVAGSVVIGVLVATVWVILGAVASAS